MVGRVKDLGQNRENIKKRPTPMGRTDMDCEFALELFLKCLHGVVQSFCDVEYSMHANELK